MQIKQRMAVETLRQLADAIEMKSINLVHFSWVELGQSTELRLVLAYKSLAQELTEKEEQIR